MGCRKSVCSLTSLEDCRVLIDGRTGMLRLHRTAYFSRQHAESLQHRPPGRVHRTCRQISIEFAGDSCKAPHSFPCSLTYVVWILLILSEKVWKQSTCFVKQAYSVYKAAFVSMVLSTVFIYLNWNWKWKLRKLALAISTKLAKTFKHFVHSHRGSISKKPPKSTITKSVLAVMTHAAAKRDIEKNNERRPMYERHKHF